MWHFSESPAHLVLRAVVIYLVFFVGLRLFGKREVGQFTLFDIVVVMLAANAVQPAITGPDSSLIGGILIIATLLLLNRGVSALRDRFPLLRHLIEGTPTVVARDGSWIEGALTHEGLDHDDVAMALREHGLATIKEAKLVTLETDGSLSVVAKDGSTGRHRRRVRFIRHG